MENFDYIAGGDDKHKEDKQSEADHIDIVGRLGRQRRTLNSFDKYKKYAPAIKRRNRQDIQHGEIYRKQSDKTEEVGPAQSTGAGDHSEYPERAAYLANGGLFREETGNKIPETGNGFLS